MSLLGDLGGRLRRAGRELLGRRPGVELVRLDRPRPRLAPRPPRPLPAPPRSCAHCGAPYPPHLATMARPQCPTCQHLPPARTMPASSPWGQVIAPGMDPRPVPLGRGPAHDRALIRDQHRPWR
jgi:hypothetical protein